MNSTTTINSIPLNIHSGIARPVVSVILTIIVANTLLLFHIPGVSFGVFTLYLGTLILVTRKTVPKCFPEYGALALLLGSALQTTRFLSLSNFLVICILLFSMSGQSAHQSISKQWVRWFEGLLSPIRPIGALFTLQALEQQLPPRKDNGISKLRYGLAVGFPVVVFLFLFGWLLSSGNAILGKWNSSLLSVIAGYLGLIEFPTMPRFMGWCFFAVIALVIVCPPKASLLADWLPKPWKELGVNSGKLRMHQWVASLIALNLLFLFSNVTDVVYLWFSQELPNGISHSQYVHHGVYALIASTVLSASLMALLTQHQKLISHNPLVRSLALVWMIQNLLLISGVYVRLWIYVDAYGYTPKRVYVALFLGLVIIGYALLGRAILRFKDIKWLIGANLLLVFGYFSTLQFFDIPKYVTQKNINLYTAREIEYPAPLYFKQVGTHSLPYLISIYNSPQTVEDEKQALLDLDKQRKRLVAQDKTTWRSFQFRDHKNEQLLASFDTAHPGLIEK
ncbi:MAG: DUF4173 domain-containing protein [Verrucomicrobia bacterium]|nr:DUF4173 domain-containing protein [Verrucomicrobiota bacterium]